MTKQTDLGIVAMINLFVVFLTLVILIGHLLMTPSMNEMEVWVFIGMGGGMASSAVLSVLTAYHAYRSR